MDLKEYEFFRNFGEKYYEQKIYEKAYVFYLCAKNYIEDNGEVSGEKVLKNFKSINCEKLDTDKCKECLDQIYFKYIDQEDYRGCYSLLYYLLYREGGYSFSHFLDERYRYRYFLLEILIMEENKGLSYTKDRYMCWNSNSSESEKLKEETFLRKKFEDEVCSIKFWVRRIVFGIKYNDLKIIKFLDDNKITAEYILVVTKYSILKDDFLETIKREINILKKNSREEGDRLQEYYLLLGGEPIGGEENYIEENHIEENDLNNIKVKKLDYLKGDSNSSTNKKSNDKKIEFIMCTNNEKYSDEAIYYLNSIELPKDYVVEISLVFNAPSMTAGYNFAMKKSDAKYKIYMHHDVFIVDKEFIKKVIEGFNKTNYKLLGVIGCIKLAKTGVWWEGDENLIVGSLYQDYVLSVGRTYKTTDSEYFVSKNNGNEKYRIYKTETLDGLILMTSEDIKWREDLFDHFHFYDTSQCLEFKRKGMDIGILVDKEIPLLHEVCVVRDIKYVEIYNKYRDIFLNEYKNIVMA
ncbi:Glycosyltransferase like family protein [Lachnospiraceae bacterium C7]|nr:Glycosyltransferase like family protein [Lachnospiraceae bacterium C7]